jgi:acyl-CoA thioesterase
MDICMHKTVQRLLPEQEIRIRALVAKNPFIAFLGIEVPELGLGYAKFILPFQDRLTNTIGLLQGGVIAALADEAVAFALWSLVPEGESINTVELKINFLAPIREGPVIAEAHIAKRGNNISLGEVEVWNQNRLVAKGLFTYIHLRQVKS